MLRISGPGLGLLLAVLLGACDSGEPGRLGARDIEGPEGEALVRHLIERLPVLDPEVPREYCVIFGRASTSMKFTERMKDLKAHFVSGDVLTVRDPDKMIIDPSNGVPPITLQITEIKRTGGHTCDAVAGWAYKKIFERRKFKLQDDGKGWAVVSSERVEGNYEPPN